MEDEFEAGQQRQEAAAPSTAQKPKPQKRASKKAPAFTVAEMQALLSTYVDLSREDDPAGALRKRVDERGMAYLLDGKEIYAVVLAPAEYDKLLKK